MLDVVWYNVLNHYRRSKTLTSLFKNSKQMDASQESPNLPSEQADTREVSPERLLAHFLGITAVSLILADAVFLLLGKFTNTHFLLNVIYGLFLLGGGILLRTGRIRLASHIFTAVLWLSITVFLIIYGSQNTPGPGPGAYVIPILIAALLLRGRSTLVYAALSIGTSILLGLARGMRHIPLQTVQTEQFPLLTNTFPALFIVLACLGIIYFAMRFTLATLHLNEIKLNQIRQTLVQSTIDLSITNDKLRREISERQQTEIALEQQRAFLRQIIDTMPQYVFVKDSESRFVIINSALADLLHSTPEEIEGQSGLEYKPNNPEIKEFETGDQAVLASGEELFWPELPFTRLDGTKKWLQVMKRPLFDKANDITHILGIASDITLIKQTTEALREKEENFRTLVEASFEGIIICVDDIIQETNHSFATMFGYTAVSDIIGKPSTMFLAPETAASQQKLLQKDKKGTIEGIGIRQDTSTFPVELVSHAISFQGKSAQICGYRDISTRKQAEEAEQHAQKLESLTIMAGGLAHDFNNLLVAMMSQISIARAKISSDHASQENLEKAIRATETTSLLTRQLLAYTGQGHFEVKLIQLNQLISENIQLFKDALPPNITFQTNLHEPLPLIFVDSAQIQQILMNLLLNGAEAIGTQAGTITIKTAPYQLTAGQLEQWQQINQPIHAGDYVLLEVADTGAGMDEATLGHIFDPFFSTKGPGRGLGLAATLGIVRGHHGSLRAESQLGKGTQFQLLFPCDNAQQPEEETAVSPPHPRRNTVLIIDDEVQVREAISDILDLEAIPTLTAANGQKGIDVFESHMDQIGLIILDLSMPGMSGIEAFGYLRQLDPTIKIILSSGYTEGEVLQQMAGTKPTGFLHKPYRLETVLSTVEKHLS